MKVDLPLEQWNALAQAADRNIELLTLAKANMTAAAKALAEQQAKAAERTAKMAQRKAK